MTDRLAQASPPGVRAWLATMTLVLRPADIRFSHDSISPKFSCGRALDATYRAIAGRSLAPTDLPWLTVSWRDGNWYAYTGNRRVRVLQQLENDGVVKTITVHSTEAPIPDWKFASQNQGVSVRFRASGEHAADRPRKECPASSPLQLSLVDPGADQKNVLHSLLTRTLGRDQSWTPSYSSWLEGGPPHAPSF